MSFVFSPSGNHHFVHPERDDHHYSISSQHPMLSRRELSTPSNDYPTATISASKVKWIDAVKTVKQMNQVRRNNKKKTK